MPDYKVSVGNVEVISLSDATGQAGAAEMFPKVAASEWKKHPGHVSPDGKLDVNFGCFVLRSQGKTILVDTGWGPGYPGKLLDDLKQKKVPTAEIDTVAITHLHVDHVGWNVTEEKGKPPRLTFPRAKYWIHKTDYEYFRQPAMLKQKDYAYVPGQVSSLETLGALKLVEGEAHLTPEVTLIPTPGHTPGHMSVSISSRGERGFILGDILNATLQTQETSWECIYDTDHALARRTREAILERLEKDKSVVGMGHAMPPAFGRVVRVQGRRLWQVL